MKDQAIALNEKIMRAQELLNSGKSASGAAPAGRVAGQQSNSWGPMMRV